MALQHGSYSIEMTQQASTTPIATQNAADWPPENWRGHLAIGVSGHRPGNAAYDANRAAVDAALAEVLARIAAKASSAEKLDAVRLYSLLSPGVDQSAADFALDAGWQLVAPLPFGAALNSAIGAGAKSEEDLAALTSGGKAADEAVEARAQAIRERVAQAHCFELAERDDEIRGALSASLADPADSAARRRYDALASDNVALAGRIMLERCDLLIAVWDGAYSDLAGGTGHTVIAALKEGVQVLLIEPQRAAEWRMLTHPEDFGHRSEDTNKATSEAELDALIEAALAVPDAQISRERWRETSPFGLGIYRRLETLFGGRNTSSGTASARSEAPAVIAEGSAAELLNCTREVLGEEDGVYRKLRDELLPGFAHADGISTRLSDAYRSGMTVSFALSALAIIGGILYLPLGLADQKWIFASIELALLLAILAMTYVGHRRRWHGRWFETRRVAEYLRFGPALTVLGIARSKGRWPRGESGEGPERFARNALRYVGLPEARVDRDFLRKVLTGIVLPHVRGQRRYHEAKAKQLRRVHDRIDRSADLAFLAAVISVSLWLVLYGAGQLGLIDPALATSLAKLFTFLGVAFPTIAPTLPGSAISAISSVSQAFLALPPGGWKRSKHGSSGCLPETKRN